MLPFIWIQCKNENQTYDLVDGQTGEILFQAVPGWFCDNIFKHLDIQGEVYVRQFY